MNKKQNKLNKEKELQPMCSLPPWEEAKSKQQVWRIGVESGNSDGYKRAKYEFEQEKAKLQLLSNQAQVEVLRSIATITDAASHALLGYKNQL